MVASVEKDEVVQVSSQDPMVDRDYDDNRITDVSAYFAKPVQIWSGSYRTSHTWGEQIFAIDLWDAFNTVTMWKNKLQGFYNFRGTAVLKLVANASPFQCGYLRMSFYPCENIMVKEAKSHVQYRDSISQLPGVYMDLSQNEVVFEVPYVAPTHYIEVGATSRVSWGKLYLHVFEVLRTGTGASDVGLTLWMSVRDAEVTGQIVPQSSGRRRKARGNVTDRETNGGLGPISSILDSGITLANRISAIPSLTSLAKPAAWALTAAKGAASALGWSKPLVDMEASRVVNDYNWYSVNCTSGSTAQPMSLLSDNKLTTIYDAADGAQDEMSINYIKVRTSFCGGFAWDTTNTAGQVLHSRPIGPTFFIGEFTDANGAAIRTMPPFTFLASLFALWRGSIEVIFKVIKTGFHSGTLAFSWQPGKSTPASISAVDSAYVYRVVLDIQQGDEVCLRLPYLLAQDYCDYYDAIGRVYVTIVNPLVAPPTVSSTINVTMFVRGGPDMEFQWPINPAYDPILPQGYDANSSVGEVACSTMGANDVVYDTHRSQLSIGEHVTSLLQLMKAEWNMALDPGRDSGYNNFEMLAHRFYANESVPTDVIREPVFQGDYLSRIASMYIFHRGALRYRVIDGSPGDSAFHSRYRAAIFGKNDSTIVFTNIGPTLGRVRGDYAVGTNRINARIYQSNSSNGGIAVQVPFYHRYRYSTCRLLSFWGVDDTVHNPSVVLCVTGPTGRNYSVDKACNAILMRSVADDFQFSYFVGVPQMTPARYG